MMADDKKDRSGREDILEIAIEEQRRVYDWLVGNYQQLRSRILAFLGGGLAGMTFLYADGDTFIPGEVYGKIFYFFALGLVTFSLSALFYALQPKKWEFPIEDRVLKDIESKNSEFSTKEDYLIYVKNRYRLCYQMNEPMCTAKFKVLNIAFYTLVFGVIILVVLKIFGA